jgi:molybdenum cofactor cytidylyltransferase
LWSRRFFNELMTLDGDIGARHLIARHAEAVAEVPVEGNGAFLDIDTPQALEAARRKEPAASTSSRTSERQRAPIRDP